MSEDSSPYAGTSAVVSPAHGDGTVTLIEGQSFCLSERSGDMTVDMPHGLFVLDTRVLSSWQLQINGHRTEPLAVEVDGPFAVTFVGRGAPARGRADADVVMFRTRHVGRGMRERLVVRNYGLDVTPVIVELTCDVDFADLFEVKEGRVRHRERRCDWNRPSELRFEKDSGPPAKEVRVRFSEPATVEPGRAAWQTTLAPGETWQVCIEVSVSLGDQAIVPRFTCSGDDRAAVPSQRLERWRTTLPVVHTDNAALMEAVLRCREDLGALRIFDPDFPERPILAAGAPWFMTVFGRDSLLTAWMTLIADPTLAHGVLETLARFQGTDVNSDTEEEPGKILHEMRFGAARGLGLAGADVYYGSVDATPLFVMLLGELRRWDPRDDVVDKLLPHADAALDWIERFGDRDGDGFVEYQRHSEHGLENQGWKDSWDAIRHADGTLATAPIALCEVQGYVYAAYVARAHFAREAGDDVGVEHFARKATELRRRFNEDFWLEEHGWYALGLDADKQPIDALASNIGHCLWTGIVDADRAEAVAERLVSDDLFNGWGIRTLAGSMAAYNPVSYHNGSVWPHDNALCAAGLARYGFLEHAHRVVSAQLDVAAVHRGRLPELFAGFSRAELAVPAAYPTSCSPQAWASAAPLLWLRTLLRLDPWAPQGQIWLDPQLPPEVNRLRVEGIRVADHRVTVTVEGGDVDVSGQGGLEIVRRPRPPLTTTFD